MSDKFQEVTLKLAKFLKEKKLPVYIKGKMSTKVPLGIIVSIHGDCYLVVHNAGYPDTVYPTLDDAIGEIESFLENYYASQS